ncbi:hypothetical protein [Paenibacillus sp. RUD330]|uniref:hypothetical protein n=1 Tax=Paenibacillus sp. RUD330 TaxID=2023772 RepID=UPI000B92CBE1|nr:hypothetical protein [Paenibacillus sp. RUD330]ASS64721.1 hypothetical protein CIC07_00305 [Paenibacillus sp. RUD330]
MEMPKEDMESIYSFTGKDDGKEKRVSLFIQGKHGKIGIIRPDKKSTDQDKKSFLESLAQVAIRSAIERNKKKDAQG